MTEAGRLQLQHPDSYASSNPALLGQPQLFQTFSYDEERELLLDAEQRDRSLRWYKQSTLGLDLRYGFERCVWRPDDLDEGLDGLLESLLYGLKAAKTGEALADMLAQAHVVTWRGMLTKILTSVYEESEGWEMNAMMLDGCLYLEQNKTAAPKRKLPQDGPQKLQTYFGYSFESFSAADTPYPSADKSWGGDVNTNVQWAGVVRTSLGGIPMIVGGEVDCVHEGAGVETGLDVSAFIELKTNLVIEGPRDEMRFERYKLLKHYIQSILLGVPSIILGFRQNNGILSGIQSFETQDIPSLVVGKPHAWHASSCFNSGHAILQFITKILQASPEVKAYDQAPRDNAAPVFLISFKPANREVKDAAITIRKQTTAEIEQLQAGKVNREKRVGFLLEKWMQAMPRSRNSA